MSSVPLGTCTLWLHMMKISQVGRCTHEPIDLIMPAKEAVAHDYKY